MVEHIRTWIKDAEDNKYHKVNYRCCPEGDSRYLFCFILDRTPEGITITRGFLEEI